ncbi:IclR family transcriptional regulator [Pseudaminobacter sp. NGMCC 1.201702]|uniref:IclR family transcriptional regulator n=1 Tax=Pseudaminobacter sp. NGMCC 1.201702 TaxID=3391825 RepID=UPI0039F0F03B
MPDSPVKKPRGRRTQKHDLTADSLSAAPELTRPTAMDNPSNEAKQGLERSFAVLDMIAAHPCRVVDVMREMNLPWATAHRTVKKLEKAQFLMFNAETSRYEIGPRMWHLGSSYLANNKMLRAAISYLANERDIRGVDVQVVERIGNYSVVIHAEKRQVQEISKAQYGYHIPLHAGSKGLILLAYETEAFVDAYLAQPLEQLTPRTVVDPDAIRQRLAEIRREGIVQTEGDVQHFTGSIAAPVFGPGGAAVGCVSFVYLKKLAGDEVHLETLREALQMMTHSISLELGWHPGQS